MASGPDGRSSHPLLTAITPLVDRIGAMVVDPDDLADDDIPLAWDGAVVAGIRLLAGSSTATGQFPRTTRSTPEPGRPEPVPVESGTAAEGESATGLDGMLADLAGQFGEPLAGLTRPRKQEAVRILEEGGAFSYRKSVETVATALGISRFTVYNYLNRDRG